MSFTQSIFLLDRGRIQPRISEIPSLALYPLSSLTLYQLSRATSVENAPEKPKIYRFLTAKLKKNANLIAHWRFSYFPSRPRSFFFKVDLILLLLFLGG